MQTAEQTHAQRPKRAPGQGTIDELRSGHFEARLPRRLGRKPIGTWPTYDEAAAVLDRFLADYAAGDLTAASGAMRVGELAGPYFRKRKAEHFANTKNEVWTWDAHVAPHSIALIPVDALTPHDVRSFRDDLQVKRIPRSRKKREPDAPPLTAEETKELDRGTIKNVLKTLRGALEYAVNLQLIAVNPAAGVRVTRRDRTVKPKPWTYLTPEEQISFATCEVVPEHVRLMAAVAWGSGLRKGELACLHTADLVTEGHRPHIYVRYGSPGKLPKNGLERRVPLFGAGLTAARRWLEVLPTYAPKNPLGLVFPTARGCSRYGRRLKAWPAYLKAAGIHRRVRWHDLRHTCASSLVAGWWGRTWSLEEVRDLLGHSTIRVTEIYAHLAESAIETAARGTGRGALTGVDRRPPRKPERNPRKNGSTKPGVVCSNHTGRASNTPAKSDAAHIVSLYFAGQSPVTAEGAKHPGDVARAIANGAPDSLRLAAELARSVLEAPAVVLARSVMMGGAFALRDAARLCEVLIEAGASPVAAEPASERGAR